MFILRLRICVRQGVWLHRSRLTEGGHSSVFVCAVRYEWREKTLRPDIGSHGVTTC
jgi:hypothetical protein